MSYATTLKRLLRTVEALSPKPTRPARKRSAPKPRHGKARTPKRAQRPAQAVTPPVSYPDVTQLVETFAPPETPQERAARLFGVTTTKRRIDEAAWRDIG
jgi:hypothetical protein